MNQVQANRLVALMNVMQTIPPKSFNIMQWAEFKDEDHKIKSKTVELKCGTTACAVGWAAISIPSWKKAFKFTSTGGLYTTLKDEDGDEHPNEFLAIAHFLGITSNEADYMFSDMGYDEEEQTSNLNWPDFKVTKPMLLRHCKKVLGDHGFIWAY